MPEALGRDGRRRGEYVRLLLRHPIWATAALPIAANVFIVARQYNVYVARTSSAILVSTAVSMISASA
jgi:predicted permease